MQASSLNLFRYLATLFAMLCLAAATPSAAQVAQQDNYIDASLIADSRPVQGETMWLALRFSPRDGWHGYWSNPGEAGLGMELDWDVPPHWSVGEPQYPVPHVLTFFGIANHAYKDDYAVLIPVEVGRADVPPTLLPATVSARWLACSDELCVPEQARLEVRYPTAGEALRAQFDEYRAAIPPMIDQEGDFALSDTALRVAIPLPQATELPQPHLFLGTLDTVDYSAPQRFYRDGDMLVVEIDRGGLRPTPDAISGILAFDDEGNGVRFTALPGDVPTGGARIGNPALDTPLVLLLGGALLGGLILNLMPCVFPILSLKALTLARAGGDGRQARCEGLAYTAGVVIACLALGGLLLALRAGGEQVGWAFQLQQPLVVAGLLALAMWITANLAGLYEIPSLPIRSRGEGGAFATGLLAAVVATPCTGPFMAAALGAALLLDWWLALLLFATLGLGLALPFLLLGFVPALRRLLPKPGPWMETFRKVMAVPMGLTALALVWLLSQLGGTPFAVATVFLAGFTALFFGGLLMRHKLAMLQGVVLALVTIPFALYNYEPPKADDAAETSIHSFSSFDETRLQRIRTHGTPIFVWFTADWCLTCKVNERVAIEREVVLRAFREKGVATMRGDWTRRDPEISRFLAEREMAGVPLYLWYAADGSMEQLPQILTSDMLVNRAMAQPDPPDITHASPPD
ncbi:protein-disulfide reductase DsbD family protein [Aurantiacibacter gangjinensis]|uniref:Uncharacterized protein n=1 Tax=Aurantiacibacter gangjinensis TaxID=502682 RepID=A0A0G9MMY5_9SPHN|nr:thioredoxin family protein [Aurantiacibacter gangjinensis]APE28154.1 Cytochrome c-type biogenesis protein DsbD, protein-disulfide reductase [Aurantiacibacter gangjinensis]KLE32065.1 hypothetical protein AAW01_11655 [Aurantiacibacter gangjinensis]